MNYLGAFEKLANGQRINIRGKETSIEGFAFLKKLQMTKGRTHEKIKQTLEAWCSWETFKWLEHKFKKKENQHRIWLQLIKWIKRKTMSNKLTLVPNT